MHPQEFNRTVIGTDYLRYKADGAKTPSIDCFLDFMIVLKELKQNCEFPPHWYDKEIEAVIEILKMETTGKV